jgi:hypothetical protein
MNPFTQAPLTVYNQSAANAGKVDLLVSNYDELNRNLPPGWQPYRQLEFRPR